MQEECERVLGLYHSAVEIGEGRVRLEYLALNARGEKVWVENSVRVIRDHQGSPQRVLVGLLTSANTNRWRRCSVSHGRWRPLVGWPAA